MGSGNSDVSSISTSICFKGCVIITCYCLWSFSRCKSEKINLLFFYPESKCLLTSFMIRHMCTLSCTWKALRECLLSECPIDGRCPLPKSQLPMATSHLFCSFQERSHHPQTGVSSTFFLAISNFWVIFPCFLSPSLQRGSVDLLVDFL